jgi:hypothetical protein
VAKIKNNGPFQSFFLTPVWFVMEKINFFPFLAVTMKETDQHGDDLSNGI